MIFISVTRVLVDVINYEYWPLFLKGPGPSLLYLYPRPPVKGSVGEIGMNRKPIFGANILVASDRIIYLLSFTVTYSLPFQKLDR